MKLQTRNRTLPDTYRVEMRACRMWTEECPIRLDRLALVQFDYRDFEGQLHTDGEIVVLDVVADATQLIFEHLRSMRFPIAKARSVHVYDGDDNASMADNNTSCFNFRPIEGTTITSIHSYGLAIDLNPQQNPYVIFDEENAAAQIHPKAGWSYLNRRNQKPGMVEDVVQLFAENGFNVWGGDWTTPIDYHHFQTTRTVAELLAKASYEDGKRIFAAARASTAGAMVSQMMA